MVKFFYLLVATMLISCAVSPAIAATPSALPPGHPQIKETIVTMTDLPPGATVHVDNIKVGTVSTIHPSQSLQFRTTPGTHKLQVQALGYRPWIGSFTINSGERKTIIVQLSPEPRKTATPTPVWTPRPQPAVNLPLGTLSVAVSPSQASVTIDGAPYMKGSIQSLQTGTHTIEVKATGYFTKTEQIQIYCGNSSHLFISLEKTPGYVDPKDVVTFEVTSHPKGASVYVDDQPNGITPCTITAPVGSHAVTLRLEGYLDRTETVDLYKTSGRTNRKVFWILSPDDAQTLSTPEPIQTETVRAATASPSQSTTISSASTQPEEPTDVLQYVIYFFRGVFGGKQ